MTAGLIATIAIGLLLGPVELLLRLDVRRRRARRAARSGSDDQR